MTREEMIAAVEAELERLGQIRVLLAKSHSERFTLPLAPPRGVAGVQKRVLSPEVRRSVAQAQKRRWAKQKSLPNGAPEA